MVIITLTGRQVGIEIMAGMDKSVGSCGQAVAGSYVDQVLAGMQGEWTAAGDVKLVVNWGGVAGSGIMELNVSLYTVQADGSLRFGSAQRGVKLVEDKYMVMLDDDGSVPMWMAEFLAVDVAREQALMWGLVPGMVAKLGEFFIEEESRSVTGNVARGSAVCTASVQEFSAS